VLWNVPDPDPHHFDGDKDGIGCEGGKPNATALPILPGRGSQRRSADRPNET